MAGCLGYDTQLCGGLDMILFWEIFFWCIPAFVFLLIPFMTFYYEADDGTLMAGTSIGSQPRSRLCEAVKYEIAVIIIFGALFAVGYLLLGDAEIPIQAYEGPIPSFDRTIDTGGNFTFQSAFLQPMDSDDQTYSISVTSSINYETKTIPVNIPTFFAGFMSFFGWFFFALFGGIGMASAPLDLLLAFIHRPRHMDPSEFADAQIIIRNRVNELVTIGETLKIDRDESRQRGERRGLLSGFSKEARAEKNTYLEFKKAVYLLEEDVDEFKACSAHYDSYNPLWPWVSLFAGLIAFIISLAWIVHIGIFMIPPNPIHSLLNGFFIWLDGGFSLLGVLAVAIFTLYLLLCAVSGCFKFGIRFMFFQIHPMKLNKTYMSSFMFNVGLILLCALPVVQFCVAAFPDYARYTNISQVMGTQVYYLKFFTFFWTNNVFVYAFIGVTGLTTLFLFCRPRDRTGIDSLSLKERLGKRS